MIPSNLFSPGAIAAIAVMVFATTLMRVGGYWLMGFVPLTPRVRRMLEALPGSVVAAIVLPMIVKSGLAAVVAVGAGMAVMLWLRNEVLALIVGTAAAALIRYYGF